jgi:hypothetical protein
MEGYWVKPELIAVSGTKDQTEHSGHTSIAPEASFAPGLGSEASYVPPLGPEA